MDRFLAAVHICWKIWRLYPNAFGDAHLTSGNSFLGLLDHVSTEEALTDFWKQRRDVIVADTALSAGIRNGSASFGAALQLNVKTSFNDPVVRDRATADRAPIYFDLCAPTQDHKKLRAHSWPVYSKISRTLPVGDIALMFPKDPASKNPMCYLETIENRPELGMTTQFHRWQIAGAGDNFTGNQEAPPDQDAGIVFRSCGKHRKRLEFLSLFYRRRTASKATTFIRFISKM